MGWYNASWINRIAITVDHTKVGASLTNFPVYLDLSKLPAAFFSNVRSDGGDIRMTKSDGTTEVAREIVSIDTVGKTGEVHFNAPSLSNTVDTVFYIYYNNPSATDYATNATYGAQNVWDSNYVGVYHGQANGNDSTVNANNLTASGTVNYTAGKLGGNAFDLGSGAGYLNVASNLGITTGAFTIDLWTYLTSNSTSLGIDMSNYVDSSSQVYSRFDWYGPSTAWRFYRVKSGVTQQGAVYSQTPATFTWYQMAMTYDGTNNIYGYQNGSQVATASGVSGTGTGSLTSNTAIGSDVGSSPTLGASMQGKQDEVRFSKIARSSTWLSTQYNNQNSSSTFYTIGGQEIQSTGGIHGTLSMMGVGM